MTRRRRKPIPLQLKLSVALVLIVMTPLAVSAYFIGQLGATAANVGASEAESRLEVFEKSIRVYHDLVSTTKELHKEISHRLAQRPDLVALDPEADLAKIVAIEPGLRAIALVAPDGRVAAAAADPAEPAARRSPQTPAVWRDILVEEPLGPGGATLRLTFEVSATVNDDLQRLKQSIDSTRTFIQIKTALPSGFQTAFLVLVGIAGVAAAGFGVWASTFVTRRIAALVSTARSVSEGQLDARVQLRGHDEMAELASAFNTMLDDLDASRRQVAYLQRMGVWQDVARRLAHEIKNPLTPIQLAVQQCVSSYKGADTDPARFTKLLADTGDIVEEEIASLRRLVDTFRTLGALPKVEAAPIALAEVIEDLKLDPTIAARLLLEPPPEPVTVRADKLLLKRVLVNLVENGIAAGLEAGRAGDVVIRWAPRDGVVEIAVDDHGKGVAPEAREKIFEPYVTTKSTGTGLGLSIARKLAIEHGGDLSVAPERAPTGGARFVVTLPLRGPDASPV
ncbi:MAG TPA: ATP-binding protein [Kofleriaceae bacterium]|nr:ATP-binding protein [Kofleriaceae bacterium]